MSALELLMTDEYTMCMEQRMHEVFTLVVEQRWMANEWTAIEYNATHQTKEFKKGDMVLPLENEKRPGFNKKLMPKMQRDPHQITEVCSWQTYQIKNLRMGFKLQDKVCGAQLRPFHP